MIYEKIAPLSWKNNQLELLDQRFLPHHQNIITVKTVSECFDAIRDMVVRGAPLIGFTGIWGAVLSLINEGNFVKDLEYLKTARPTAVNLVYELDRCLELYLNLKNEKKSTIDITEAMISFAHVQFEILAKNNQTMAELALGELDKNIGKAKYNIMTICNTGYLACGPIGTALGVISHAHQKGRVEMVYPTETRPYLQGSRLTAYELLTEKVPFKLIVEGAFSHVMKNFSIDAIFVGADRIAKNGDTANKIGTSTLAIVAKEYDVPFYVVAPSSSFDLSLASGEEIPIEYRDPKEITEIRGEKISPLGIEVLNPSFDVTSNRHITGIICENGMITSFENDRLSEVVLGK